MNEKKIEAASQSLERLLGFFERVDGKASFLFALDTALIALLCLNLKPADLLIWYVDVLAGLTGLLLTASFFFVYQCTFPSLKGGVGSLIYFREIASRTEANFIEQFEEQTEEEHWRDLLGQVWRNSEILRIKFDSVKTAFILTALAIVPWAGYLIAVAILHAQVPIIK